MAMEVCVRADGGFPGDYSRDDGVTAELAAFGAKTAWPDGFAVYRRGSPADGFFIVTGGSVVLRVTRGRKKFVPAVSFPGETFGSEGLSGGDYLTDALSWGETETLHVPGPKFRALVRERPAAALALVAQMAKEHGALISRVTDFCGTSVDERLASALTRIGTGRRRDSLVLDSSDQRMLCEMVSATRESVALSLGRLVMDGAASRDDGRIIVSVAALREHDAGGGNLALTADSPARETFLGRG